MSGDSKNDRECESAQWEVASTDNSSCSLIVRVTAGARRNSAGGIHQGALKISVTQIAEKGKANKEVLKLLAKAIGVKRSQLQMISGETSRMKKFLCQKITEKELIQRLNQLMTCEK